MQTVIRDPHVGDPVIVWDDRGTIVLIRSGFATIDSGDDLRVQAPLDRLRWDPLGAVWLIVIDGPPEPVWLHEDDAYAVGLERGMGYHDVQADRHSDHTDQVDGCSECENRAERVGMFWARP